MNSFKTVIAGPSLRESERIGDKFGSKKFREEEIIGVAL